MTIIIANIVFSWNWHSFLKSTIQVYTNEYCKKKKKMNKNFGNNMRKTLHAWLNWGFNPASSIWQTLHLGSGVSHCTRLFKKRFSSVNDTFQKDFFI